MMWLRFVLVVAVGLAVSCSANDQSSQADSDRSSTTAATRRTTTSTVLETTTTSTVLTTSTTEAPVAFPSSPSEFEARVQLFGGAVGFDVGTFAPVSGSDTFAAPAGEHVVGYQMSESGDLKLVALLVGIEPSSTSFATPTQLLAVVATTPVGDGDTVDKALAVYQRETLPDLGSISDTANLHSGGAPYYQLHSIIIADEGALFVVEPSSGPSIIDSPDSGLLIREIVTRLGALLGS